MKLILFVLTMCAFCAQAVFAQDARGSITGRVVDPQASLIPGATIVITGTETNAVRRTTANQTGYFEATLLEPGEYTVSVEAPGFKKAVRNAVQVNVATKVDLEIQMQIGQVAETVEVTAEAPLLET